MRAPRPGLLEASRMAIVEITFDQAVALRATIRLQSQPRLDGVAVRAGAHAAEFHPDTGLARLLRRRFHAPAAGQQQDE